jgi:hypothetical protein
MRAEHVLHFTAQLFVAATSFTHELRTFSRGPIQRRPEDACDLLPAIGSHLSSRTSVLCNHAFGIIQSRSTVVGETFSTSAVSSSDKVTVAPCNQQLSDALSRRFRHSHFLGAFSLTTYTKKLCARDDEFRNDLSRKQVRARETDRGCC